MRKRIVKRIFSVLLFAIATLLMLIEMFGFAVAFVPNTALYFASVFGIGSDPSMAVILIYILLPTAFILFLFVFLHIGIYAFLWKKLLLKLKNLWKS